MPWIRRTLVVVAVLAAWGSQVGDAPGCPFCTMQGQTLTGEMDNASMVLYGRLVRSDEKSETSEFEILKVIKGHPSLDKSKGKGRITLHRYFDLSLMEKGARHLVYIDLFKDKVDPYRGVGVKPDSKIAEYLSGADKVKDQPVTRRLRFFFDWLDNDDLEISNDAYKEFGNSDYKDFLAMAKGLPADRIVRWLKSPDTPAFRFGLYASMLGHCGTEKDAAVLKALLDDPDRRSGSGADGIMAGYAMLKPKQGWDYIVAALKNTKEEFMFRYAALRAVRFLHDYRPDVVGKKALADGVCVLLDQDDIADLAIEDLRKWRAWDRADRVLAVQKTEGYKLSIVRRALLRYCLQCQGSATADAYVAARRKADPDTVKDVEETLKLEQETLKATAPKKEAAPKKGDRKGK